MKNALTLLASAWSQPLTRESTLVYAEFLADIPPEELMAALRALVVTSKYRPSVAEIREEVLNSRHVLPTGEAATAQAEALDDWYAAAAIPLGAQREPVRPDVHPTVDAAWQTAGPGALPAVFLRCWREEKDRYMAEALAQRLDQPLALGGSDG